MNSRRLLSAPPRKRSEEFGNGSDLNPLKLSLSDLGVDDLGYWKCYTGPSNPVQNPACWDPNAQRAYDSFNANNAYGYPEPVFAAVDVEYSLLPVFQNDLALQALVRAWQSNGGAAPELKDAGFSLRFTVDGTATHEAGADCSWTWTAPDGVLGFEYSFKTRIRFWKSQAN